MIHYHSLLVYRYPPSCRLLYYEASFHIHLQKVTSHCWRLVCWDLNWHLGSMACCLNCFQSLASEADLVWVWYSASYTFANGISSHRLDSQYPSAMLTVCFSRDSVIWRWCHTYEQIDRGIQWYLWIPKQVEFDMLLNWLSHCFFPYYGDLLGLTMHS